MKRHIFILAVFAVACSTPNADRADDTPADGPDLTRTAEDDRPEAKVEEEPQPFRLQMDGEKADWFVPFNHEKGKGYANDRVVGKACGMHVFSESDVEALVYCLGDDAPQLIEAVPGTHTLRFSENDVIVAFTDDKRLLHWKPESEQWEVRNDELPASSHTDAVKNFVVVADDSKVWLSKDRGNSFEPMTLLDEVKVEVVLVRPDGLVVVDGKKEGFDVAFSAMPPYDEWNAIRASNKPLYRKGSWIKRAEFVGTLAEDGDTWVRAWMTDEAGWRDYLWPYSSGDSRTSAGVPRWTIDNPPAPDNETIQEGGGGQGFGRIGRTNECSGAGCMDKYPRIYSSHIRYSFIGRYLCDHSLEPENGYECPTDAEIVHTPRQAAFDSLANDFLAFEPVEPWMRGVRFYSHGGLGFARRELDDGRMQYWVTGTDLAWSKEATLDGEGELYNPIFAPDGTMLVRPQKSGLNVAWIRPPVAPGEAKDWRKIEVEGGVFYRPLPGGEALAIVDRSEVTDDEEDAVIDLVRIDANGDSAVLMEGIAIAEPEDRLLLVDDEGRVFLTEDVTRRSDRHEVLKLLLEDGTWR